MTPNETYDWQRIGVLAMFAAAFFAAGYVLSSANNLKGKCFYGLNQMQYQTLNAGSTRIELTPKQ